MHSIINWGLHVLPIPVCVLSEYSGFLPETKDTNVTVIGETKLGIDGDVSVSSLCVAMWLTISAGIGCAPSPVSAISN